jgi:superfamily II DNA or RNA helicase
MGYLFDKSLWDNTPQPKRTFRYYPHQVQAVTATMQELESSSSCYVVSATGTGKTEMICRLIKEMGADKEGCVVISPRRELVGQTAERLRKRGIPCGIEMAAQTSDSLVTVASYCSLLSRRRVRSDAGEWKTELRADRFVGRVKLVVVDECHLNFTTSGIKVLTYFRDAGAKCVGFTATPRVGKAEPLSDWYGKCAWAYTYKEARDDGFLVPVKLYMTVLTDIDYSGMEANGEFALNSLKYQRWCRQEKSLQPIRALIEQEHDDQPCVVFVSRIDQAKLLAEMLTRSDLRCSIVHSGMDDDERRDHLRRFENGETNIIINVGVLLCGWDFPPVRKLFICRPTQQVDLYTQAFGRGVRPLPGVIDGLETAEERRAAIAASDKPYCEIYDFCDASRHARLVTAMDVLHPERRELRDRRPPQPREGTNELDPDAIVAAEERALARQRAADDAMEMSKRKSLLCDAKFAHYERDPLADAEIQDRGPAYRVMLWGKHKRKPFHMVPTHYLEWTLLNCNPPRKHPGYFPAIRKELARRRQWKSQAG